MALPTAKPASTPWRQIYALKGLQPTGGKVSGAAAYCKLPLPLPIAGGGAADLACGSTCFYFAGGSCAGHGLLAVGGRERRRCS